MQFQTHSEKATDEPWLEVHQRPVYSEDGGAFLLLAAVQEGGGQYYTHIKHVDVIRQRIAVLSHGKVEVAEILAWDQENHLVYYLGEQILLFLLRNNPTPRKMLKGKYYFH